MFPVTSKFFFFFCGGTIRLNGFFVTFWKLIRSHAVTRCWLDDASESIQSGWRKQRDYCFFGTWNPGRGCRSLRKLNFSKIIWRLQQQQQQQQQINHRISWEETLVAPSILNGSSNWMPWEEVSTFQFNLVFDLGQSNRSNPCPIPCQPSPPTPYPTGLSHW